MKQSDKWVKYRAQIRQGKADDEYYTRYEDVELMLSEFDLQDKIVYCPCDSEKSAFVKWFSLPGKCKELIYTSDDFHLHQDLFNKCDVVVTNPPFSKYKDFWEFIGNKDFILVCPMLPKPKIKFERFQECKFYREIGWFIRPDGSLYGVRCQWVSNLGSTTHPDGYSFEELYGKPIPLRENPVPMRSVKVTPSKIRKDDCPEYVNVYGKKSGYPLNEKYFIVTAQTLCRDFVYYGKVCDGIGTCLVSLNPKYL